MADRTARKSTIVRPIDRVRLAGLRAVFGSLDRVAPTAGARLATRLWCTPPRRRRPAGPAAQPGHRFVVPLDGRPIAAESWGSGPATYLLHGWGGWRGQLDALVAPLVAAGQRVVALDAPGHGDSGPGYLGGRRSTLPEFASALRAVAEVTGPPRAVIAHSAGCQGTALAVSDGLAVDRLVFVAPLPDPWRYLPDFVRVLGLPERIMARFDPEMTRRARRELAHFDLPARAAAAPAGSLPPLLVIHDQDDREVAHADAEDLAAAWPDARLISTEGLGHRRILRDPATLAAAVDFVTGAGHRATGPGHSSVARHGSLTPTPGQAP